MRKFLILLSLSGLMVLGGQTDARANPPKMRMEYDPTTLPNMLFAARKAMIARLTLTDNTLRKLADRGDGYAAWLIAERWRTRGSGVPDADVAHYYALAAETGRIGGLRRLIEMLSDPDFEPGSPRRMDRLERLIYGYSALGHLDATMFLADAWTVGRPFGDKKSEAVALLSKHPNKDDAEIALALARRLLFDAEDKAGSRAVARHHLDVAAQSENLSTRLTAVSLLATLRDIDPASSEEGVW
ncbi:MAG: hypothetical protein AAGF74_11825 [Pseudomonadota bacterium]